MTEPKDRKEKESRTRKVRWVCEGENEWERWTERETENVEDYGRKRQLWRGNDDRPSGEKVINVDICVCVRVHLHHLP